MDRSEEILALLNVLVPLVKSIDRSQAAMRADIESLKKGQATLEAGQARIEERLEEQIQIGGEAGRP